MIIVLTLIADTPELSAHPSEEDALAHLASIVGRSWSSKLSDEPIPLDPVSRVRSFFSADDRDFYWFLRPESANRLPEPQKGIGNSAHENDDSQ